VRRARLAVRNSRRIQRYNTGTPSPWPYVTVRYDTLPYVVAEAASFSRAIWHCIAIARRTRASHAPRNTRHASHAHVTRHAVHKGTSIQYKLPYVIAEAACATPSLKYSIILNTHKIQHNARAQYAPVPQQYGTLPYVPYVIAQAACVTVFKVYSIILNTGSPS